MVVPSAALIVTMVRARLGRIAAPAKFAPLADARIVHWSKLKRRA